MTVWQKITSDIVFLRDWIGFFASQAILGPATMMLIKGTMPPPFSSKKANPVLATGLLILGMALMLAFGVPDLLQRTLAKFIS